MNWPRRPLQDIADVLGGGTPSRTVRDYWDGEIPWVTPTDLPKPGRGIVDIRDTEERITERGLRASSATMIPAASVLYSSRATIGKIGIARVPLATNQGFVNFVPKPGINTRYLAYTLLHFTPTISQMAGSTTFKEVRRGALKSLRIPVPPLAEQEGIVRILDEAEELRRLRREADRRTADLIPALFHEMFGDPATNPKGWPVEAVGELFDRRRGSRCGPFGSALKKHEYVDVGVPVWGIPNVLPNQFAEEGSLFISPKKFEQLRGYSVESGDLLVSRAGTVGRICVARPSMKDSIIGTNLVRLALEKDRVVPEFFAAILTHYPAEVGSLRANADSGSYSFMNTSTLKTLRIFVPQLQMQQEFATRVAEIRTMEERQAESRRRLGDLAASLLHRAFAEAL